MFKELDTLLARKNQRIICGRSTWLGFKKKRFVAQIEHHVGSPLATDDLHALRSEFADLPELVAFYERYGSLRLYCGTMKNPHSFYESAYYIGRPDEWPDFEPEMRPWMETLSEQEAQDHLPAWINDFRVIGEYPATGNYILLPLKGPERGIIVEFNHDGFAFIPRGATLAAFIAAISSPSDENVSDICGHVHYADGTTNTQWICEAYVYDDR
jgi:hypothetical protein